MFSLDISRTKLTFENEYSLSLSVQNVHKVSKNFKPLKTIIKTHRKVLKTSLSSIHNVASTGTNFAKLDWRVAKYRVANNSLKLTLITKSSLNTLYPGVKMQILSNSPYILYKASWENFPEGQDIFGGCFFYVFGQIVVL